MQAIFPENVEPKLVKINCLQILNTNSEFVPKRFRQVRERENREMIINKIAFTVFITIQASAKTFFPYVLYLTHAGKVNN